MRGSRVWNRAERPETPGDRRPIMRKNREWFKVTNRTANEAEVYIYDEIGYWGVTAKDFADTLNDLNVSTIQLKINSPGGEVFDGVAIYNALKSHRARIEVTVDGLAASAASFIAMAGDSITMARGSTMMIHDAQGVQFGQATDFRAYADRLDQCSDTIASFYAERAGQSTTHWRDQMRAETWYTAEEAVAAGLADSCVSAKVDGDAPVSDQWDLSVFAYAGRHNAPAPTPPGGAYPVRPTASVSTSPPTEVPPPAAVPAPPVSVLPEQTPAPPDAPFAWDPEIFRAVMADAVNNMPALPAPPEPEPAPDPPAFDPVQFVRILREVTE